MHSKHLEQIARVSGNVTVDTKKWSGSDINAPISVFENQLKNLRDDREIVVSNQVIWSI